MGILTNPLATLKRNGLIPIHGYQNGALGFFYLVEEKLESAKKFCVLGIVSRLR